MMNSGLLQTTALRTTLNLEAILKELSKNKRIDKSEELNEKDRAVYIFNCFDIDKDGDKIDFGYELLSPSIIENQLMLLPYPLEEDLFANVDFDNSKQLETIVDYLDSKGIKNIFTGLLPENAYFMGSSYSTENEVEEITTYMEPLNLQESTNYIENRGLKLIHCGNLPETSSNEYLN